MAAKQNPKRWYLVMVFCIVFSYVVFAIGPKLGYEPNHVHDIALLIALWAPVLGIMGLRAEAMQKKE